MKISNDIRKAFCLCLRHQVPFVAFAEPSEKKLHFRSSLGQKYEECDEYFFAGRFASPSSEMVRIPFLADGAMTVEALEDAPTGLCDISETEMPAPTDHGEYIRSVGELVETLKARGGKTVISRTFCGELSDSEWLEFAKEYFDALPMTYRFIFYTPETGAWIVATPELLFHYNRNSKTAFSMALAGTRKTADDASEWDDKNKEEHAIVSRFIAEKLEEEGVKPEIIGPVSLKFGEIEHLCTTFSTHNVSLDDDGIFRIIDSLNPTPALAGYPLADALSHIIRYEKHDRDCYGGVIGMNTATDVLAVVNLRSLRFSGSRYCLYAGGGIMPGSDPQAEWEETEAKTAPARNIISRLELKKHER